MSSGPDVIWMWWWWAHLVIKYVFYFVHVFSLCSDWFLCFGLCIVSMPALVFITQLVRNRQLYLVWWTLTRPSLWWTLCENSDLLQIYLSDSSVLFCQINRSKLCLKHYVPKFSKKWCNKFFRCRISRLLCLKPLISTKLSVQHGSSRDLLDLWLWDRKQTNKKQPPIPNQLRRQHLERGSASWDTSLNWREKEKKQRKKRTAFIRKSNGCT